MLQVVALCTNMVNFVQKFFDIIVHCVEFPLSSYYMKVARGDSSIDLSLNDDALSKKYLSGSIC